MERYNYLEAVTADAKDRLLKHYEIDVLLNSDDYSDFYDEMFIMEEIKDENDTEI